LCREHLGDEVSSAQAAAHYRDVCKALVAKRECQVQSGGPQNRYNLGGLRREHPRPTMCILKRSCDAPKLTTRHSSHAIKAALMIVVEPDANCETPICFVSSKIHQKLNLYLARFAKI